MTAIPATELAHVFVEIADTLVDDFDLVEFLQSLSNHAAQFTDTHSAAVLLCDDQDRLHFMAASDERTHNLELFQLSVDEGPCVDCFRFGAPITNADLSRAESRWPQFAPRATDAGILSVHAFPLRLRKRVVGAMGLFSGTAASLDSATARILQALADVATIGILQERALRHGEVLTRQLQSALSSRIVIEQAKGFLAQKHELSIDEAFERLRAYCRNNGLKLSEVAQLIVDDPDGAPDLDATSDS